MEIPVTHAQLNKRPDGSIEILGETGHIVLTHKYAAWALAAYEEQLKKGPGHFDLRFQINIEIEEPTGSIVHPEHPWNK